jgi:hypothetical protein
MGVFDGAKYIPFRIWKRAAQDNEEGEIESEN